MKTSMELEPYLDDPDAAEAPVTLDRVEIEDGNAYVWASRQTAEAVRAEVAGIWCEGPGGLTDNRLGGSEPWTQGIAAMALANHAQGMCPTCAILPAGVTCHDCDLQTPCDCCGGKVVFRGLESGALLCSDCTRLAIPESRPLEARRREFVLRYVHGAISAAAVAGSLAIEWVAFNPRLSETGLALHGTVDSAGLAGLMGMFAFFWIGHGIVEHFWPGER